MGDLSEDQVLGIICFYEDLALLFNPKHPSRFIKYFAMMHVYKKIKNRENNVFICLCDCCYILSFSSSSARKVKHCKDGQQQPPRHCSLHVYPSAYPETDANDN